jgi:hypothetical protein
MHPGPSHDAGAPLLRLGEPLGVAVTHPAGGTGLPEPQQALPRTFADQAVIAIENARLFRARTAQSRLGRALEQQTATAEVLRVIAAAPTDLQSVLQAIIETAARLCDAQGSTILQLREADSRLSPRVLQGRQRRTFESLYGDPFTEFPGISPSPHTPPGRALLERRTVHVHDMVEAVETSSRSRPFQPIRSTMVNATRRMARPSASST